MAFTDLTEPSSMCNVTMYRPVLRSERLSWAAAFIVFTNLPATSLTETDFTPFISEIFKTSWNGLGYTERLALVFYKLRTCANSQC